MRKHLEILQDILPMLPDLLCLFSTPTNAYTRQNFKGIVLMWATPYSYRNFCADWNPFFSPLGESTLHLQYIIVQFFTLTLFLGWCIPDVYKHRSWSPIPQIYLWRKNLSCGDISDFYAWQMWRILKFLHMWSNFKFLHMTYVDKSKFSPHVE